MNKNALIDAILRNQVSIGNERVKEASIRKQEHHIATLPQLGSNDVKGTLEKVLPKKLVPMNIGKYEDVAWPFFYEARFDYTSEFDFGAGLVPSASYIAGEEKVDTFRVGQESSLILTGVYRQYNLQDLKGKGAPLKFTVKNRQSTRQFNDQDIQIQHVGDKGHALKFPIPLLVQPNSSIEISMKSFLSVDVNVQLDADESPKQNLIFFGYRVRSQDVDTITQLMFG